MSERRLIPDPDLTLMETMHLMSMVQQRFDAGESDAVLESAWDKLRVAAAAVAREYPEEFEAVKLEINMAGRFRGMRLDLL